MENLEGAYPRARCKAIPRSAQNQSDDPEHDQAKWRRSVRKPQPTGSAEEKQGKDEQQPSNENKEYTSKALLIISLGSRFSSFYHRFGSYARLTGENKPFAPSKAYFH